MPKFDEIFVRLLSPPLFSTLIAIAFLLSPQRLANDLALAYFGSIAACIFAATTFQISFDRSVTDRFAFSLLLYNGAVLILLFAAVHNAFKLNYVGLECFKDLPQTFVDSLYFSIVTFTTLGYGDFQPVPSLRFLAGIQALMGYVFLGFVVAIAIDWMRESNSRESTPQENNDTPVVWDFIVFAKIFEELRRRLLAFFCKKSGKSPADEDTDNNDQS